MSVSSALSKADSSMNISLTTVVPISEDVSVNFDEAPPEVSIIIPCLNEAKTIGRVVGKAWGSLRTAGIRGEIIVADNGSTDGSQAAAVIAGAQVIAVTTKGYGAALRGGFAAARGKYIIMGDADDSYDFSDLRAFFEKFEAGYQFVMGSRLKGEIIGNAMRPLHRWLGNPALTFLGNLLFGSNVSDFCCGLRGFDRLAMEKIGLRTEGMETALEMIVKSTLSGLSMTEVPIKFYPDGRGRMPHLKTWRDGWKHLKFFALLSPKWMLFLPGLLLALVGVLVAVSLFSMATAQVSWGLLVAIGLLASGLQLMILAPIAHLIAVKIGVVPPTRLSTVLRSIKLGIGIFGGAALFILSLVILLKAAQADNAMLVGTGILGMIIATQVASGSFLVTLLNFDHTFQ